MRVPDEEGVADFGGIRYLSPQRVAAVAKTLAKVDPDQLVSRLDRADAEAKRIYLAHTLPEGWEISRSYSAIFEISTKMPHAAATRCCSA